LHIKLFCDIPYARSIEVSELDPIFINKVDTSRQAREKKRAEDILRREEARKAHQKTYNENRGRNDEILEAKKQHLDLLIPIAAAVAASAKEKLPVNARVVKRTINTKGIIKQRNVSNDECLMSGWKLAGKNTYRFELVHSPPFRGDLGGTNEIKIPYREEIALGTDGRLYSYGYDYDHDRDSLGLTRGLTNTEGLLELQDLDEILTIPVRHGSNWSDFHVIKGRDSLQLPPPVGSVLLNTVGMLSEPSVIERNLIMFIVQNDLEI
jgi:hypothetical protein